MKQTVKISLKMLAILMLLFAAKAQSQTLTSYSSFTGSTSFGLAVDGSGNVYASYSSGVFKINISGTASSFVSSGLSTAKGIAVDASGNLYIANSGNNTVSEVASSGGTVSTFINSDLSTPYGIAIDGSGNIYVSNSGNNTISKYNSSGTLVSSSFATGLSGAKYMTYDAYSNSLYVSGTGSVITKVTMSGSKSTFISSGLSNPVGLATDADGNLYICDQNNVALKFATTSGTVSTLFTSSNGLVSPLGLAFDATQQNLFLINRGSNGTSNTIDKFTYPTLSSFGNISKHTGDVAFNLTNPTSNSNGAFIYTSSNTSVVTISGSTVTIVGAGSSTITATQAANATGSANYLSGTITATLTVSQGTPTISAASGISAIYSDGNSYSVASTTNTGDNLSYTIDHTNVATVNTNTGALTIVGAGTATVTVTDAGNTNYTSGTATVSVTVNAIAPTIGTFTVASQTYGASPFSLTAPSSNSAGTFTYSSDNASVATISGSTVTIVGAGTATITATEASNGNYTSGSTTAMLTVGKAALTIGAGNQSVFYGTPVTTVTNAGSYNVSGYQNGDGSSVISGTLAFTTTYTPTTAAGVVGVTITPVVTGLTAANYVFSAVSGSINIVAAVPSAPTITNVLDSDNAAIVIFTAPSNNGSAAITGYTVTSNPGSITATGSSSPIKITGLTNGTAYTFTVTATNTAGTGAASVRSNSVTPSATTLWNGITWSAGPPTSVSNAVVSSSLNNTQWGGATSVARLTISKGVTFALTGSVTVTGEPNVNGAPLQDSGTISGGIITLAGSVAQTISGMGLVNNFTVNNSNGVAVTSGTGNNLGISGALTLQSGTLTTNGNVTMKSLSITNSGVLAPVPSSGASISGNVTVERYIPAGYRGYRDLAPQVYNASYTTGNIFTNWQEGGSLTHNGYGIFITGPTSTDATLADYNAGQLAANSTTGLDYSLNGISSAYTFNNANGTFYSQYASGKIDSIVNTKTANLDPFQGYRVLVRGDRSFNLATTSILNYPTGLRMYNPTTLRATGNLVYGTVTYSTTGVTGTANGAGITSSNALNTAAAAFSGGKIVAGLSMVANPYDCPVSWTSVYNNSVSAGSNINGTWYFLDPTYSAAGTYEGYNYSTGSQYSDEANATDLIQAGQAFLVLNATSSPVPKVVFQESAKQASSTKLSIFGATAPLSKIYVELYNGATRTDGSAIAFRNDFTNNSIGSQDAYKLGYGKDYIAISDKGVELGIDGRLPATASDAIALKIGSLTTTTYQLKVDATRYINNGFTPSLLDSYKNTTTALGSGVTTVDFTVDANTASSANRFSIIFTPSALAINSIVASATLNNKIATITWNTAGEKGESYFEVEKSTDGKNYASIDHQAAKNTSTASYTATDNDAVATTSYYRIKAVSETGSVAYSNIAKLTTHNSPLTTIYPNPLVGKTLNVSLNNLAAGKYVLSIYNALGQKVNKQTITHTGGSGSYVLVINKNFAVGIYNVAVREVESKQVVYQTSLSVLTQ